jgi:hypothetical protein
LELSPSIEVDNLPGWSSLSSSDQSAVSELATKDHPTKRGGMVNDMLQNGWFLVL